MSDQEFTPPPVPAAFQRQRKRMRQGPGLGFLAWPMLLLAAVLFAAIVTLLVVQRVRTV